jgi:hypothetical protein
MQQLTSSKVANGFTDVALGFARIRHELTFRVSDRCAQQLGRHHRPILLRSLHRPLASTEGRLTENLNKNAVRLWT